MSLQAAPLPVALRDVEIELARLMQSVGESQSPDAPAVMRALAANLIAFAPTPPLASQAAETLAQVIGRHPSRAILLQVIPELPAGETRAEVALACQSAGEAQMCCEYIALGANGDDDDLLPSAALSLQLADLPTFLWWLGDPPFGSPEFMRLSEAADRKSTRLNSSHGTLSRMPSSA